MPPRPSSRWTSYWPRRAVRKAARSPGVEGAYWDMLGVNYGASADRLQGGTTIFRKPELLVNRPSNRLAYRPAMGLSLLLSLTLLPCPAEAQPATTVASPPIPPALAGTWKGTLVNLPGRPNAPVVSVTMELGAIPTADSSCVPWKTTYTERDTVRAVKDYRLCRGTGAKDLYVDEGGGVRLAAQLLGDVLTSAFKVGTSLLVTHLRVRGDTLEEEIISMTDKPATEGIVTMVATNIQRLRLTRVR